ncbi:MAG: glycosyltransferase family 2 protein [Pseudomonadota bacterium]
MPLDLPVVGSLEIPPHEMPVLFSAGLAVHRGHGKLVVKVIGESHTETFDIPFDTAKHGGRRIESYQRVSIVLPACSEQTTLSMKISAGGAESNDAMDTYFFLVEPRVTPFLDDCEHESVVVVRDTAQVSNTKWLLASPLARVAVGSELKLIANDGAMSIMEASNCVIKLHEDRGHTIFLSASEAGRFGVFIDGKLAFSQFIGSEPTAIRIPKLYLTGAYRFISVWDISGLREFFGTYVHCPNTLTPKDVLQIEGKPPYPTALGDATAYRYLGLKSQLTVEVPDTVRLQASYCLEVLERGHKAVELKPLSFPEVQDPDVSIVLPVHNKIEVTYLALCSLLFAQNKTSFEVVLVDDASTDETSRIESIVSGLRVVRHEEPQRFIRACNHGAEQARGKYVVLLNNDVEVTTF